MIQTDYSNWSYITYNLLTKILGNYEKANISKYVVLAFIANLNEHCLPPLNCMNKKFIGSQRSFYSI